MSSFQHAAICRRGHVESTAIQFEPLPAQRCGQCGAKVLFNCEECDAPLRGQTKDWPVTRYKRGEFCWTCGSPFPWASRQARFHELENLLEDEDLEPAMLLQVRDELHALREAESDDQEAARRWSIVQRLAPGLIQGGGRIIETVATAAIKTQLGLHP